MSAQISLTNYSVCVHSFTGQKEEKKKRQAAGFCHRYIHGYVHISFVLMKYIMENSIYFNNVVQYQLNHSIKNRFYIKKKNSKLETATLYGQKFMDT